MSSTSLSSTIPIDFPITAGGEGEIKRSLDLKKTFEESRILGVSFHMSLPPFEIQDFINWFKKNTWTQRDFLDWTEMTIYEALDSAVNQTKGFDEFEITWSPGNTHLCHLTSPYCHTSIFPSSAGILISGLLYNKEPPFNLYDFLGHLLNRFKNPKNTIEITPITRPD